MHAADHGPTIETFRAASPSGTLQARVIIPADVSGLAPLVVLHGISRNADDLAAMMVPLANDCGRIVIVPHFTSDRWPHFQRPCRAARPDLALLALLTQLAAHRADLAGPIDLFGHSGGAQLAHRFAMLYPHRIARLGLAAAGWYCLPDTSMSYPYGLGADAQPDALSWARRHKQALPAYLRLRVEAFVGTLDTDRDDSLRKSPNLDRVQGATRIARAETFVKRFRAAAQARLIRPDITLTHLPGVAHDAAQVILSAEFGQFVAASTPMRLPVAI